MFKNKKGGIVSFIFLLIMFNIVWFIWLGSWLSDVGTLAITTGGAEGIEAFFYANLNMWVFLSEILGIMLYLFLGGQ